MTDRMIENRIKKLMEIKAQIEELEKAANAVKEEIKADMAERGTDTLVTEKGAKVYWKEVSENRFDTTTFKKEHAYMYTSYTKKITSRPFRFFAA